MAIQCQIFKSQVFKSVMHFNNMVHIYVVYTQ